MKTNVYVDGFNFYYSCFKRDPANGPYKWLDFRALAQAILPSDQIHRVYYFTAMVSEVPWNPGAPLRQETYIRALRSCPMFYVQLGKFQPVTRTGMPTGSPPGVPVAPVTVDTWQEKGSDVNLATRMLVDAMDGDFEQALVISNDSDLMEPIRVVKQRFKLPIIVISPSSTITNKLRRAATSAGVLDTALLPSCQLKSSLKDKKGRPITKPASW